MLILILLAVLLVPVDSKISMLDGQSHSGSLVAISSTDVEIKENGENVKLPIDDVMVIEVSAAAPTPTDESQMLFLTDGSQLRGTSVTRTAKSLSAKTALFGALEVKVEAVHAVRLQADNPSYTQQWNTFLKRDSEKDNLVVAKRDGSGLDFLAGIVSNITAERVEFLLDGDTIPVPAERVYGIVFGRPAGSKTGTHGPRIAIQLTSVAGDQFLAKTIELAGEKLKAETSWGQTVSISMNQLQKLDLSSGRIQYLSDIPAVAETFYGIDPEGSLFAGLIAPEQQKMLFGPQRDMTIERQARMRLRGREYSKGLCIHSRSEIQWTLEKRFTALECVVGVDDEVAFNGKHAVALKITGDDKVLFEKLIGTTDDPQPLRLPLDGVSRLTVLVDFGDGSSVCDWLDIADAKLIIAKEKL